MESTSVASEQLAARGFRLERNAFGRLVLTDADVQCYEGVEVNRAFPISCPGQWISISDPHGHEVLCIRRLEQLPAELRQIVEEELAASEFVPIIRRLLDVQAHVDPSRWRVETDRGPITFMLDSEESLRRLGPFTALFIDMHGIRYLIPDTRKLPPASRRLLERRLNSPLPGRGQGVRGSGKKPHSVSLYKFSKSFFYCRQTDNDIYY